MPRATREPPSAHPAWLGQAREDRRAWRNRGSRWDRGVQGDRAGRGPSSTAVTEACGGLRPGPQLPLAVAPGPAAPPPGAGGAPACPVHAGAGPSRGRPGGRAPGPVEGSAGPTGLLTRWEQMPCPRQQTRGAQDPERRLALTERGRPVDLHFWWGRLEPATELLSAGGQPGLPGNPAFRGQPPSLLPQPSLALQPVWGMSHLVGPR